jgi:hypothetical protein
MGCASLGLIETTMGTTLKCSHEHVELLRDDEPARVGSWMMS